MLTMSWLYCHEQSMRTGMSPVKSILQITEFLRFSHTLPVLVCAACSPTRCEDSIRVV